MTSATSDCASKVVTSARLFLWSIVVIGTCKLFSGSSHWRAACLGSLLLRPARWYFLPSDSTVALETDLSEEPISRGCAKYFLSYRFAATKPNFTCPFHDVVRGVIGDDILCGGFPQTLNHSIAYIPPDPDTFCNLEPIPPMCLEESFRLVKSRDRASDAPSFEDDEYTPFMEYQSDRCAAKTVEVMDLSQI